MGGALLTSSSYFFYLVYGTFSTHLHAACSEGFYGDGCEGRCQCRNTSECHFATGSCTCQAGFTGSTCHDSCPDGSYGLACALTCPCFDSGTRSCDPISGSCDCNDLWMGELCDGKDSYLTHYLLKCTLPVVIEAPTAPTEPAAPFQAWWVVVGVLAAFLAAGVVAIIIFIVTWRKKKRKSKVQSPL